MIGTETVDVLLVIFVEVLLPKTKLAEIVGIIYRPSNKSNFIEIINANFDKQYTDPKELYILGDFNVSIYQNNKCIVHDDNTELLFSDLEIITNFIQFIAKIAIKIPNPFNL